MGNKFPNVSWRDIDMMEREGQALEDSIQSFIKASTLVNIDAKFRHQQAKRKIEELREYRRKMENFSVYSKSSIVEELQQIPVFHTDIDKNELERNQNNVEFHSKLLDDPTKAAPVDFFRASLIRSKPILNSIKDENPCQEEFLEEKSNY